MSTSEDEIGIHRGRHGCNPCRQRSRRRNLCDRHQKRSRRHKRDFHTFSTDVHNYEIRIKTIAFQEKRRL